MSVDSVRRVESVDPKSVSDKWILSRFESVLKKATLHLDRNEFSQAAEALRDFTWGEFADWYLEIAKVQRLDANLKSSTEDVLLFILQRLLSAWHPFMPFVTEVIWKEFGSDSLLMIESWPTVDGFSNSEAEQEFESLKEIVVSIRNVRSQQKIEPKKIVDAVFVTSESTKLMCEAFRSIIVALTRVNPDFMIAAHYESAPHDVSILLKDMTVFLKLESTLDPEKEKVRIEKEIAELTSYLESLAQKLSNKEFRSKAPEKVIGQMEMNQREAQEKLASLQRK